MLIFSKEDLRLDRAKKKEWIITNGLGSYSSSTTIGLNTRKYHGLLIAALNKPLKRHLLLSKFDEELVFGKKTFNLGVTKHPGNRYHPRGYEYQDGFMFNFYPTFNYHVDGVDLTKSIIMVRGSNAVVVSYKINSNKEGKFLVRPFVNSKNFHTNTHEPNWVFNQVANQRTSVIRPSYLDSPAMIIGSDKANYKQKGYWSHNVEYEQELLRGYDFYDDQFCPGEFVFNLRKGLNKVNFLVVGDRVDEAYVTFDNLYSSNPREYDKFFEYEMKRINSLIKQCYEFNKIKEDKLLPYLVQAADSFIVNKNAVIAGYHWFDDYGRDAMVSLPGLCLATGRIDDAKNILLHYSKYIEEGLIPIRIKDSGEIDHTSVDTSLWFIYACYKFYKYTNNLDFVRANLWSKIKDIIRYYKRGTKYGIKVDYDGLIKINSNIPLTWMDTKHTLRNGKPVEINALWYNTLKIAELFAKRFREDFYQYVIDANLARDSFDREFWNHEENCLYDVVDYNFKDKSIRPNQIFAVSLPFRILNLKKEYLVVKKVTEELLTPYGLRSLSPRDDRYIGIYEGNREQRDLNYHNGTSWGWLLGPYITSYLRIHNYSKLGKEEAMNKILNNVVHSLRDYGIGTIGEIYDGNAPFKSRGCISQAWSVAEIIRAYVEDVLKE